MQKHLHPHSQRRRHNSTVRHRHHTQVPRQRNRIHNPAPTLSQQSQVMDAHILRTRRHRDHRHARQPPVDLRTATSRAIMPIQRHIRVQRHIAAAMRIRHLHLRTYTRLRTRLCTRLRRIDRRLDRRRIIHTSIAYSPIRPHIEHIRMRYSLVHHRGPTRIRKLRARRRHRERIWNHHHLHWVRRTRRRHRRLHRSELVCIRHVIHQRRRK